MADKTTRAASIAIAAAIGASEEKIPRIVFQPAYDGGRCNLDPVSWPYPVVFDIAGMEPLQVIPIVRDHDQNQKVGQTDRIGYGPEEITAEGRMIHIGIDEAAGKVLALWKRGAKLQASVHTDLIPPEDVEYVEEGQTAQANGQTFEGPVEIVRRTRLREISIVTVGANAGTSVEIEAAAPALHQEESEMTKSTKTLKKARIGRAAEEASTDKEAILNEEETKQAEARAEEETKDAAAEEDEAFAGWLAARGFAADGLDGQTLDALRSLYDEAACADGDEDAAAGEGDEEAAAEEGDEDAAASMPAGFVRRSARTRARAASASNRRFRGPAAGGPNAARIAEASLLISCGMKPEKLDRKNLGEHGFGEEELNEAVSGDNRGLTPMGTLFRAGMCSGANYKDFGHVSRVMNQAKFQGQLFSLRPGEYVSGSGRVAQAAGNLASVDIPTILANVMYKSLLVGFKDVPDPTDDLSKVVTAQDFRPQYFWTLDSNGNFEEVKENGELNVLKLADTPYQNQVKLRGAECRYSYQMMIDDDQNALADIPQHMGRRFKIQKQQYWWGVLCGGIAGGSATTITSNPALSVGALDTAFGQMAAIYDDNGEPIIANPKFVIGPTALGGTIRQIHTALDIVAAGGNALSVLPNANVYANAFTPVVTPFVGGASKNSGTWGNAGWAVLADPADLPAVIMGYLKGNSAPTMETKNGDFAIEGVRIGTWWGFGASLADTRGLLFSTGAGS